MKLKLFSTLLALSFAVPALAQTIDLGNDVSGYTRFLVYPHLQKGLEWMYQGDRERALAELERARSLAPDNATVALHLASAYRRFGDMRRAESLLREQMIRTPRDSRVTAALTDLMSKMQPPATAARPNSCADRPGPSCQEVPPVSERRPVATSSAPSLPVVASAPSSSRSNAAAGPIATRRERGQHTDSVPAPSPALSAAKADPAAEFSANFTLALQTHRFDDAERHADSWLALQGSGPALLDSLTYQLVTAGATDQATRMLLRSYPYSGRDIAERAELFERLILLVGQQHLAEEQLSPLRTPLDTPALRSRQAALWAGFNDCAAVRGVLQDMSPDYGYDDWMRLGDCSTGEDPALAQRAYMKAHTLQPGGRASQALAYQAHAAGDFETALAAWRSVGPEHLLGEELLGAVTTALAASSSDQAASWLATYSGRGEPQNHRYWSLLADTTMRSDPAAAVAALERAVELEPAVDDYLRLARLTDDSRRQILWLERAATLDPDNSNTQAQLGYAYSHAGLPGSAAAAFERAAALDPENMTLQSELGYAYWSAGLIAKAESPFERAWHADPSNQQLAQQLVYVHQRLKHNR